MKYFLSSKLSLFAGGLAAIVLTVAMPLYLFAATLTSMSDTLSTQTGGQQANHRIAFTSTSGMSSGTITINFSNVASSTGSVDDTDVDLSYGPTGVETDASLAPIAGAGTWGAVMNSLTKVLTLTFPTSGGTTIGAGEKVIVKVGTNTLGGNAQMTNAAAGNSKMITISAGSDSGNLAVALLDSSDIGVQTSGPQSTVATPTAPSGLTISSSTSTQVVLSWSDTSSNESSFIIERSTSGGSFVQVGSVGANTTSFTDNGLSAGVSYTYRVLAQNSSGNSAYSNSASVTTPGGGGSGSSGSISSPSAPAGTGSTPLVCTVQCQLGCPCNVPTGTGTTPTGTTTTGSTPATTTGSTPAPSATTTTGTSPSTPSGTSGAPSSPSTPSSTGSTPASTTGTGTTAPSATTGTGIGTGLTPNLTTTGSIFNSGTFITNPSLWNVTYTNGTAAPYSNGVFCSQTPSMLIPCIPPSAFPAPVSQTSIKVANATYPLVFDTTKGCYTGTVPAPAGLGAYFMALDTTYVDGTHSLIDAQLSVRDSCQDFKIALTNTTVLPRVVQQLKTANQAVSTFVKQSETALEVTSVVLAGSMVALVPSLLGNLPSAYHYIVQSISWIFSLFGYKKRRRKQWGIVYDAFSKEPESLAIVRLYDANTKKLLETQVTDQTGRFSFFTSSGTFLITVTKVPFEFPSRVVTTRNDSHYQNIYRGEPITLKGDDDEIAVSIPIDPKRRERIHEGSIVDAFLGVLERYGPYVAITSFVISLALVIYTPNPLNIVIFVLNIILTILQFAVVPQIRKSWGIVYDDTTLEPIGLATISLFDATTNKLVRSRLSDYRGRFNFLVPPGRYTMLVSRPNYTFPAQNTKLVNRYRYVYFGGEFEVKKDNAIVRVNIPMHKRAVTPGGESDIAPTVQA